MAALCHHGGGDGGKWIMLGGLGVSVGTVRSVFGWTWLVADNTDTDNDNDNDNDTYGTKNGVNVPLHHQSPP
eukprot:2457532-Ditylum_brightwellii.AAC.1